MRQVIAGLILLSSALSFAQATTTTAPKPNKTTDDSSTDRPLTPNSWQEVHQILDNIREQNIDRSIRLAGRSGFTQIQTNVRDTVNLGGSLAAIGLDGVFDIYKNVGFEVNYLYAQNVSPIPDSPNPASAYIYWLYAGPRYTFYFDSTQIDDYLAIKLLYHVNENNFKLTDPTSEIFMNRYSAYAPGIERSIPLTRKLGILASFYLIQILSAQSSSALGFKQQGYGFRVSGELYYQLDWFSFPVRMGVNYMQSGYENEFADSVKNSNGKNSYFQLARSIFLTATALF